VSTAVNAIVSDHDDPEKLGRVKVRYPTLDGEPESHWLRVVAPGAGSDRGLHALPSVGDEVLVVFLYGSQDTGVVVGPLFNGRAKPPREADDGMPPPSATQVAGAQASTDTFTAGSGDDAGNDRRLWRSRSGHLLVFDDTDGACSVQLWDGTRALSLVLDGASRRILLANTAGDLHVRTAGRLFLEAGGDVVIRAGGRLDLASRADAAVDAGAALALSSRADASLRVGGSLTLGADTSVSITAHGTLALSGTSAKLDGSSTTQVTAGAMVEVRAGLVKIN
jgi:uncharacterized protein involved in type VI secretion and phage assembly